MAPLSILPLLQLLTSTYPSSLDKCDSCWEFSKIVDDDDDGDHGGDDDDGDEVEEKNEGEESHHSDEDDVDIGTERALILFAPRQWCGPSLIQIMLILCL